MRWTWAGLAAACILGAGSTLVAQPILDEENPGVLAPPSVPVGPLPGGLILDEENIDVTVPAPATGSAWTTQPETRSVAEPRTMPLIVRGRASSTTLVDLSNDRDDEETLEFFQLVGLRARVPLFSGWSATLEGRMTWWVTGSPGNADHSVFAVSGDAWQGRVEAELRDAFIAGRVGPLLVRVGQFSVGWGSSDLTSPANVVQPVDLRNPLLLQGTEATVPMPMAEVVWARERFEWQFLAIPFFVPSRFAVYGSDAAIVRPGGPAGFALPTNLVQRVIHPSLEDLAQPLLQQTEIPEELPSGASAGTRMTVRAGGADVSLGYLFDWDRTPRVALSEGAIAALDVLDGLRPLPGGQLSPVAEAVGLVRDDLERGVPLLRATHHRRHTVVFDAVRYFGPIGLRVDAAYSPERTWLRTDLRPTRRPTLAGSAGLGWESGTGGQVIAIEAFHQRVLQRPGEPDLLAGAENLTALIGAYQLRLDEFTTGPLGKWGVETAVAYLPRPAEMALTGQIRWRFSESSSALAGVAWIRASEAEPSTLALIESLASAWVRLETAF